MKNKTIITMVLGLLTTIAVQAKHGADDQNHHAGGEVNHHKVVCTDANQNMILTVLPGQQSAQANLVAYSISVAAVGGDIRRLALKDNRSGDMMLAQRAEQILTVTLTTDENPNNPSQYTVYTHKGLAQLNTQDETGDGVNVYSYERRGESIMNVTLVTDENPTSAIKVSCKKSR